MTRKTQLIAALAAAFAAQAAMAVTPEFHGYLRSGSGASSEGGREVCFGINNGVFGGKVGSAGRLGNECETYGELAFDAALGENGGIGFKLHTMLALVTNQTSDFEQYAPAWRQTWVEATNIGSGALSNASAWVGKRYYKRRDVHIVDFFQSADTGPGAGIENIDLGVGKFAYAIMRNNGESNNAATNHDLRLEGINVNPGGSLAFTLNIVGKNKVDGSVTTTDAKGNKTTTQLGDSKSGSAFGVAHTQDDPFGLGGFNQAEFQYSKDNAGLSQDTGNLGSNDSQRSWRIFDHWVFDPKNGNLNGAVFIGYGRQKEDNGGDAKTFSLVARPVYHFTDAYSLAVELGTQRYTPDRGDTQSLTKLTIAPQLSVGKGFWARPVLRAYYTYASWNDAAKAAGVVQAKDKNTALAFANKNNGSTYGFQMEAWW